MFQEEHAMKRSKYTRLVVGTVIATILAGLPITQAVSDANDEGAVALVCYKWPDTSDFSGERLRISVRKPAPIVEGDPAQQTWGFTGRHVNVCGEGTASTVRGVIVNDGIISRMGAHSIVVRGDGDRDSCRSVHWDCTADEPDLPRTPLEWACEGRNEFGESLGYATLEKMDAEVAAADPACTFFESGLSVSEEQLATGTFGN
jgi:hypothetical protein